MGRTFKIEYKDLRHESAFGLTDARKSLIIIEKTLKGKELEQTMLHEFFHAVLSRTGASQALSPELEEIVVEAISTFLVDHYDFHLE